MIKVNRESRQNGSALVYVLIASVIIILVNTSLFVLITKEKNSNNALLNSTKALYVANAGVNYVLYQRKANPGASVTNLQNVIFNGELIGQFQVSGSAPNYSVEGLVYNTSDLSRIGSAGIHIIAKKTITFSVDTIQNAVIEWREVK